MPAVMLRIFPPAIAAILITGAIAAMISTADSLLILSAIELSENFMKSPSGKQVGRGQSDLRRSRAVTAVLALIALLMAYISPSHLIYTVVGYVWAGIGGTFSVVILLTLFWKRFHGKAALLTIIVGVLFTVFWISVGLEERVTARLMTFVVAAAVAIVTTLATRRKC
jgi:sodium/proline symporter